MRTDLNYRIILMFFLPLIFMTELHQISHSLVHAFLARLADPKLTIAAFSVAFAFNTTVFSSNPVSTQGGISFITDRVSFWQIFRFYGAVGSILFIAVESIALTPMGDILFGKWMGASAEVVKQARFALAIMALWVFPNLVRNLNYALAMVHRRTILIPASTLIRLVALGVFLIIYSFWLKGASVGAAATVSAMTVEAVYIVIVVRPLYASLEKVTGVRPSYYEIWRFSWPLMVTQSAENGVAFAINFFLGRLSNPDLALAGFGVVNGLLRTCLSPVRNLVQTAQALIRSREDLKIMFKFTFSTVLSFVAITSLLFYSPLQGVILKRVMGLTLELSQYTAPGVKLMFLVAIFWGYSALLRGIHAAIRRTGVIAATAGLRLLIVVMVCSIAIFMPQLNGTVIGVIAISVAFAVESLFLAYSIRNHFKASNQLFSHLQGDI